MSLLSSLVGEFHARFGVVDCMADVAELVRHDRYQASDGIEAAAAYVAERATAAGVTDVEVIRYPADGGRRWWTFTAPQAWTPRGAELRLESAPGTVVASYPRDPYRLAAHSAPTPDGGVCAPLAVVDDPAAQPLRGAVALLDPRRAPLRLALPALDAAGVVGVVIGRPDGEPGQASRVELPPYSCLFAFSVPGPGDGLMRESASLATLPCLWSPAYCQGPMPQVKHYCVPTSAIPGLELTTTRLAWRPCSPSRACLALGGAKHRDTKRRAAKLRTARAFVSFGARSSPALPLISTTRSPQATVRAHLPHLISTWWERTNVAVAGH